MMSRLALFISVVDGRSRCLCYIWRIVAFFSFCCSFFATYILLGRPGGGLYITAFGMTVECVGEGFRGGGIGGDR